MIDTRNLLALAVLTFSAALVGCQKTEQQTPASPPAAKVDGAEISLQQVDSAATQAGAAVARGEVLDKLIDQQLTVQQALTKGLDRKPDVVQALEAARRDVLSRAYAEQVAAAQPKPTQQEIAKFYGEHPELFAQRRVYSMQQLAVPASGTVVSDVKAWVAAGKSIQEVAALLKARNIPMRTNEGVAGAEQLPTEIARKYLTLKDGQTTVTEAPFGLLVVHLLASQSQPVERSHGGAAHRQVPGQPAQRRSRRRRHQGPARQGQDREAGRIRAGSGGHCACGPTTAPAAAAAPVPTPAAPAGTAK